MSAPLYGAFITLMMTFRQTSQIVSLLIAPLFASPLFAQSQQAPATTLHVNVKVVTMAVTVRDKHGAIVPNLTKDDFTLAEDGRPQTIQYFNRDTNLSLTLGLLVDTSMSQRNVLDAERTASQHFLDQMMTDARDKAFLIQFDREVDLLADVSPDKNKLRAAIDQLGAPQFSNASDPQDTSGGSHRIGGGGTMLYDAIYLASDELMKKQPGRKALVVLTDGVDRGSKETLFSAIEAAQRADTVVYAIYFKGEEGHNNNGGFPGGGHRGGMGGGYPGGGYPGGGGGWPGGGGNRGGSRPTEGSKIDGKKVLEQVCGETGGRMFEVTKKESVDQIYSSIAEELRAQYILGYTPDKKSTDTGYHKITLTAKKKDLFVQTRQGYYAGE
ncbi:MAG: VWA domain-containing protein [Silvibacterium sp.]